MRRIFRVVKVLVLLGVLAIVVLVGWLWIEHRSEVTLPATTGRFAVGRTIYDWVDDAAKRELLVWIWYPADGGQPGAVADDYIPAQVRPPAGRHTGSAIFRLLTRDASKVHGHSLRNAEVSPKQPSYPVVIMRAGASAPVVNYSTLNEDLASHGYFVVGFDAPCRTSEVVFPDGRVIGRTPENDLELVSGDELAARVNKLLEAWTSDIGFALDRLPLLNASDPSGKFTGRLA